jgi:hypothetical protein
MDNNSVIVVGLIARGAVAVTLAVCGVYVLINGNHYLLCGCGFLGAVIVGKSDIKFGSGTEIE